MEILALTILIVCSLAGFAAIFFTTFGTFIILIGALLYSALTGFLVLSVRDLIILLILYLFGEAAEYVFVILGAKKLGASNKAAFGALIGGIVGAIVGAGFLGIGLIFGTFLGIFLGALVVELVVHKDLMKSFKAGTGGVLGRVGSIIAKVLIAAIMFAVIVINMAAIQ